MTDVKRLEDLRSALEQYGDLLDVAEKSLSVSERGRAVRDMAKRRGDLARMIGRDREAIVKAVGGVPRVQTGYRDFGDAFNVVLSEPDHPMTRTALEGVLRCVEQAIGYHESSGQRSGKDSGPATLLHPRLASVADKLLTDGHIPQALFEASKALSVLLQEKSGLALEGLPLVEQALAPANPVLVFNKLETQTDRDEHRGIFHLAQGVMLGVRHVGAHGSNREKSEARALELLATVNYLTYRIDSAKRKQR